jgi:UDP-N-acetylglucosamine 2-epimerase (non-hydrolysing)
MDRCYLVLTDSGGLQEEAPHLGKPVLVLRNVTERPEAVEAGTLKVIGTERERIFNEACTLIKNEKEYNSMANAANPFGDGGASVRIVSALLYYFNIINEKPGEFIPENKR